MVKHIVMWKLKEEAQGADKVKNAALIKSRLEALKPEISEIAEIEVGIGLNEPGSSWDVVLYSVFNTQADLDGYQAHPRHLEVGGFIKSVVEARQAVDYKI